MRRVLALSAALSLAVLAGSALLAWELDRQLRRAYKAAWDGWPA